eukprot:TRINITY_DN7495_c0_g4_i3.p1 TRINITY_DN7495_c0_g4~~TRINITY_DN7495_c0_g4_i3.p1  ORF type:complete len:126 (+),score=1.89 TRINITY_DN7495_c0_g4_i3:67-444(+)
MKDFSPDAFQSDNESQQDHSLPLSEHSISPEFSLFDNILELSAASQLLDRMVRPVVTVDSSCYLVIPQQHHRLICDNSVAWREGAESFSRGEGRAHYQEDQRRQQEELCKEEEGGEISCQETHKS